MNRLISPELREKLTKRFEKLYDTKADACLNRFLFLLGRYGVGLKDKAHGNEWTEQDAILITYGDMIQRGPKNKIADLCSFLNSFVNNSISTLHILPFFPYSSDDGFSVIDYRRVRDDLGDWDTIETISTNFDEQVKLFSAFTGDYAMAQTVDANYKIMADLVINHVSRESSWFRDYVNGVAPARNYFIEADPDQDLSDVVRPRSKPLLTQVTTKEGEKHLWTTFSEDQIDVDFSNPDVLFEFLDILLFYISKGISVIRLDAIAYLWKKLGTSCIHLPETHEVVKLIREVVDLVAPHVTIITETNVPHEENISYFGDGDEAHMVYQFSLPPLLLHAIQTENASYLTQWAQNLEEPPEDCLYFNFTASHDGIGVRPLEGLVPDKEFETLVNGVKKRGGYVSYKTDSDGNESPYELNITYLDAFKDPEQEDTQNQIDRFMCSQTIMLTMQGVPGIYLHSLTGTTNYTEGVERTGEKRAINRKKWDYDELVSEINDESSITHQVLNRYNELLYIRKKHPAFHPHGKQQVYNIGNEFFVLGRTSPEGGEKILSISNVTGVKQEIDVDRTDLPIESQTPYLNLLDDENQGSQGNLTVQPFETLWLLVD